MYMSPYKFGYVKQNKKEIHKNYLKKYKHT